MFSFGSHVMAILRKKKHSPPIRAQQKLCPIVSDYYVFLSDKQADFAGRMPDEKVWSNILMAHLAIERWATIASGK